MSIDFTSNTGKLRLRCGDISSLPFLPDSVYSQTLTDSDGNLPRAAQTCAQYILAMLSFKGHRKLAQLEVWGEQYKQYKDFLLLTVSNPAFMSVSPIPYSSSGTDTHPLIQFQQDWNKNFAVTQSQQLAFDASVSPNDGSLYGIAGSGGTGWNLS